MSLWTPSGEHRVPRETSVSGQEATQNSTEGPQAGVSQTGNAGDPQLDDADTQALDPEVREELEAQMAEVRQRILETPIEAMIVQHVIGLFEIAAIHLNAENPNLVSARLAIDAMDGALDATEGRLGDAEEAMQSMLHQARMAYVQVNQQIQVNQQDSSQN